MVQKFIERVRWVKKSVDKMYFWSNDYDVNVKKYQVKLEHH